MELYIVPTCPVMSSLYSDAAQKYLSVPLKERDAALDAFVETDCTSVAGATERLLLGCKVAAYDTERQQFRAFWLLPRSSISKSPLRMANSVGLIDAGYRGILMGAVDFRTDFTARRRERYFQIASSDLLPWKAIHIVDEIPGGATLRGEGGFGSTGLIGVSETKDYSSTDMGYFH